MMCSGWVRVYVLIFRWGGGPLRKTGSGQIISACPPLLSRDKRIGHFSPTECSTRRLKASLVPRGVPRLSTLKRYRKTLPRDIYPVNHTVQPFQQRYRASCKHGRREIPSILRRILRNSPPRFYDRDGTDADEAIARVTSECLTPPRISQYPETFHQ